MFGIFCLAFIGLYAIHPIFGLGITLGFFATMIEGEIYKQNITQAFKKLFKRDYTERKIILKFLKHEIKHKHEFENDLESNAKPSPGFYDDYKAQKAYLQKLKKQTPRDEVKLQQAKVRIRMMEDYFIAFVYERQDPLLQKSEYYTALNNKISAQQRLKLRREILAKLWLTRLGGVLSMLGGIACTFVFTHAIQFTLLTSLGTFGLGASAAGGPITIAAYVLAVAAGTAYSLMIYTTVSDMVRNNTLRRWARKVKKQFMRKTIVVDGEQRKESLSRYLFRLGLYSTLLTTVLALNLFATLATAGTWWYMAKAGVTIAPFFVKALSTLKEITISSYVSTEFLFNISNSLETFNQLTKVSLKRMYRAAWDNIKATKAEENWLQFCNPFRLAIKAISLPAKIIIFIGHIFGVGVTSDRLRPIPAIMTATVNASAEFTQDFHYVYSTDEHSHSDIPGAFIKFCLAPIYLLSGLWDYGFGHLPARQDGVRDHYKRTLSQSIKRSFNVELPALLKSGAVLAGKIKTKLIHLFPVKIRARFANSLESEAVSDSLIATSELVDEPELSEAWRRTETYQRVTTVIRRLQAETKLVKESANTKVTVLQKVTTAMVGESDEILPADTTPILDQSSTTITDTFSSSSLGDTSQSDPMSSTEDDEDALIMSAPDQNREDIVAVQAPIPVLTEADTRKLLIPRARLKFFGRAIPRTVRALQVIEEETGVLILTPIDYQSRQCN